MARHLEGLPDDPVLVVIDEHEAVGTFDEWLALTDADEPTDVDVNAAEILRDIRDHGEH